jgi:hypothetical protein
LCEMDRTDFIDGFELDNDLVFNEEVEPRLTDARVTVVDLKQWLPPKLKPRMSHLDDERLLVHALEKSWAQGAMHSDCCPEDPIRKHV